jgi:ribosome-associated translation inhibitor RaiA
MTTAIRKHSRGIPDLHIERNEDNCAILDYEIRMQSPLRITFRHIERSAALELRIQELVGRLEHFYDRIIGCHVVIESATRHPSGKPAFLVHVELTVPGGAINASSAPTDLHQHQNSYVAVRDAFEAAKRQLLDFAVA